MPAERYFSKQLFTTGQNIPIEEQEFHHLLHVMRSRLHDEIELVNGLGQLAAARLTILGKKNASAQIEKVVEQKLPDFKLILAQAIPRINRLEFILEKGTELGMTEIWLFPSTHSDRKQFTEHQLERFRGITIAAMKQCGRLYLPKITLMPQINEWPKLSSTAFFGDVQPNVPLLATTMNEQDSILEVLFCVGPESGFTDKETMELKERGAKGVSLHPNILRTDTAALAALSVISHLCKLQ